MVKLYRVLVMTHLPSLGLIGGVESVSEAVCITAEDVWSQDEITIAEANFSRIVSIVQWIQVSDDEQCSVQGKDANDDRAQLL